MTGYNDAITDLTRLDESGVDPAVGEMIKDADVNELLGVGLEKTAFADPHTCAYPFHTPVATLGSLARLKQARTRLGENRYELLKTLLTVKAAAFGVSDQVELVMREKAASAEPTGDMPANLAEARAALSQLTTYPDHFDLSQKAAAAVHLLAVFPEACDGHRETLQKWAGLGVYDRPAIAQSLGDRARLYKAAGRIEEAMACAETAVFVDENAMDRDKMAELAETVDRMDREGGLHGFDGLLPADQFCSTPLDSLEKAANDLVETKTGTAFSKSAMATIDPNKVRDLFGSDYYNSLCDGGLLFSVEKAAAAVENADAAEDRLWRRIMSPVI